MKKILGFVVIIFSGFMLMACQSEEIALEFNLEDIAFSIVVDDVEIDSSFITAILTNHSNRNISYGRTSKVEYWSETYNEWISIYEIDRTLDLSLAWIVLEASESVVIDELSVPVPISEAGLYRLTFEINVLEYNSDLVSDSAAEVEVSNKQKMEVLAEFSIQ